MNKLAKTNWKVTESKAGVRPRRVSIEVCKNLEEFRSELRAHERVFRKVCDECYSIFKVLPVTTTENLF